MRDVKTVTAEYRNPLGMQFSRLGSPREQS